MKNIVKLERIEKVDSFDKDVIKRELLQMFQANDLVTLRKLKARLLSQCDIAISKTTLWKIVRGLGLTYRKSAGGRNIVCEKPHLILPEASI